MWQLNKVIMKTCESEPGLLNKIEYFTNGFKLFDKY